MPWGNLLRDSLRALLIQIGVKLLFFRIMVHFCLRALLIQIGVKRQDKVIY